MKIHTLKIDITLGTKGLFDQLYVIKDYHFACIKAIDEAIGAINKIAKGKQDEKE